MLINLFRFSSPIFSRNKVRIYISKNISYASRQKLEQCDGIILLKEKDDVENTSPSQVHDIRLNKVHVQLQF